jgi:hypothetical protein
MNPRVPELIQPLLEAYMHLMAKELPSFLTGFYLHGSITLDAFSAQLSDIDFTAFISRQCTANDFESHHTPKDSSDHCSTVPTLALGGKLFAVE